MVRRDGVIDRYPEAAEKLVALRDSLPEHGAKAYDPLIAAGFETPQSSKWL